MSEDMVEEGNEPPTCNDCGSDLRKVQLETWEGEWICPSCNEELFDESAEVIE